MLSWGRILNQDVKNNSILFHFVSICKTFLASNIAPGPYSPLRAACLRFVMEILFIKYIFKHLYYHVDIVNVTSLMYLCFKTA